MSHIKDFVVANMSNADAVYREFGIHPVITLSHSAKESGWGTSTLAKSYYNFFGMMAGGGMSKYWSGKKSADGKWKTYKTAKDSFLDYGRLISSNYPDVYKYKSDPDKYALAISQSRYMTDADNRTKYHTDFLWINNEVSKTIAAEKLKFSGSGILSLFLIGLLISKIF
ncbi:hypothetical protein SDC9_53742 [bioreactor metagenome]|uniref:Mannosyl-glycoprotein endo-beta-N-acetylglucosamidase-like domain-containing protein n=1 Tax=bioreactor metagenome TaxID=1076179 RepID=A0A644WU28_9ZZZZ